MSWQPIETAPKDAAPVDLWTSYGERVADATWNAKQGRWLHWTIGGFDSMGWYPIDGTPTHWMPLPPPPKPSSPSAPA